jgi:DnaK suppressor protein
MPRASKASGAAKPAKNPARKSVSKTVKGKTVKGTTVKGTTAKKGTPKRAAPSPTKKAIPTTTARKAAPAKKVATVKRSAPQKAATTKKTVTQKTVTPQKAAVPTKAARPVKKAGKVVLDKFGLEQQALLLAERTTYAEQAESLKAEADQLAAEMEPGDIQFDDESGEGATATVDRERDLALSAQARQEIEEIDHALHKLKVGTYGTCESCGQPIPKARLKAIPHARLCVACKSGGLSRR